MLAASVFTAMVRQCNSNQDNVTRVQYVSDNIELVKQGQEHWSYVKSYANTTLRAEYDLTEQIYMTNQENKIKAKYSWVKGHQDDTKSSEELSLLAQLNVEVDALAGKILEDYDRYSPWVPVLPASSAMLTKRRSLDHKPL